MQSANIKLHFGDEKISNDFLETLGIFLGLKESRVMQGAGSVDCKTTMSVLLY